jgi:lipopolysaccharide/colanic/teichoic acid biosynthesis glycosyltransferase
VLRLRNRQRLTNQPFHERALTISSDRMARLSPDVSRYPLVKRAFDVALALFLLALLAPLMAFLALAIKVESAGPVLYRSRRVGAGGREFEMLKFRKMHRDAAGPPLTSRYDERFTRVGALLARTKLDELPQLWNVIRGDMSLVGPRPEDPCFVALYPDEYWAVHRVRPGITGLSQLAFAKENHILERPDLAGRYADRLLPAKIGIDTVYVARRSLLVDTQILAWTVAAIVFGVDVAVDRQSGRLSIRRRPKRRGSTAEERAT